jgi:hypothetical protein
LFAYVYLGVLTRNSITLTIAFDLRIYTFRDFETHIDHQQMRLLTLMIIPYDVKPIKFRPVFGSRIKMPPDTARFPPPEPTDRGIVAKIDFLN